MHGFCCHLMAILVKNSMREMSIIVTEALVVLESLSQLAH